LFRKLLRMAPNRLMSLMQELLSKYYVWLNPMCATMWSMYQCGEG
jgi:hypothetical protein